jgi:hypothetical protein
MSAAAPRLPRGNEAVSLQYAMDCVDRWRVAPLVLKDLPDLGSAPASVPPDLEDPGDDLGGGLMGAGERAMGSILESL